MDISLTSKTKLYTLLGCPVEHSISPVIQNSIFAAKGLASAYIVLNTPPDKLLHTMTVLKENFGGFNITLPHKQTIMEYLDVVDANARLCGAVNTVRIDHGKLLGFNTDGYGFMQAFSCHQIDIAHKRILLLGAGGAARAAICQLLQQGCQVTIMNRTWEKAKRLEQEFAGKFSGSVTVISSWRELQNRYDCLINTTLVGMYPHTDKSPIDPQYLNRFDIVYDLIYNPDETKLLQEAKRCDCTTMNGFPMLFYQAVEANRIWTDQSLPGPAVRNLYEKLAHYLQKR